MGERFDRRQRDLLDAWRETAHARASGPEFDFTDRRHSVQLRRALEGFLDDPSEATLGPLWTTDTLRAAVVGTPKMLVRAWDSPEALASFLRTVRDAEDYDDDWEETFVSSSAAWELYGRLHPEREPILTGNACRGLQDFGYGTIRTFADGYEAMESFREDYEAAVGHVTADTDHEVTIYEEMEAFLHRYHVLDDEELRRESEPPEQSTE
jgi:hypothetical protein